MADTTKVDKDEVVDANMPSTADLELGASLEEDPSVEEPEGSAEVETPEAEAEPAAEEPAPAESEAEEPPVSRREALRIQQVIEKAKQGAYAPKPEQPAGLDYRTALDADEAVYTQLEADRKALGESQYNSGLEQAKSIQFHTRLEIDAPRVYDKYPQLDKNSAQYNPAVQQAVDSWYLATTGYDAATDRVANPSIRYSEFVEGIFELGNEIAGEKVQATVKNVAKQAAQTGIRPNGQASKQYAGNDETQMSNEQLESLIKRGLNIK